MVPGMSTNGRVTPFVTSWIVSSPKEICWGPSSRCLRMWPYLETGSCRYKQVNMRSLGRALIQNNWRLYKKRRWGHQQAQREDAAKILKENIMWGGRWKRKCVATSWGTPEISGKQREAGGRNGLSPASFRVEWPSCHLDFGFLELWDNTFPLPFYFDAWHFGMTAVGNYHTL